MSIVSPCVREVSVTLEKKVSLAYLNAVRNRCTVEDREQRNKKKNDMTGNKEGKRNTEKPRGRDGRQVWQLRKNEAKKREMYVRV